MADQRIVTEAWIEETKAVAIVDEGCIFDEEDYCAGYAAALRHLAPVVEALAASRRAWEVLNETNFRESSSEDTDAAVNEVTRADAHLAALLAERGLPSEWLGGAEP